MVSTLAIRLRKRLERTFEPLRGGGRGWALVAIALGWLLILGTRITVPVLLPGIKASFEINNATAGFVVTVIWGVYGLSQFPAGLLTDRIGDRRMLIVSLAVMTLSVVALGFSPVFVVFILAAALVGVGNGLFGHLPREREFGHRCDPRRRKPRRGRAADSRGGARRPHRLATHHGRRRAAVVVQHGVGVARRAGGCDRRRR
jgi:hypothetical protein